MGQCLLCTGENMFRKLIAAVVLVSGVGFATLGLTSNQAQAISAVECQGINLSSVYSDKCYVASSSSLTFGDHASVATTLGMSLTSIHSFGENSFVQNLLSANGIDSAYLGGLGVCSFGGGSACYANFGWEDGSPMDYINWANGMPHTSSFLTAIVMTSSEGEWDAQSLSHNIRAVYSTDITISADPLLLPPSAILFGTALLGLGAVSRRRRKRLNS